MIRTIHCYHCGSERTVRHGYTRTGEQRYHCRTCSRSFVRDPASEVVRVLIADDYEVMRESIRLMLSSEPSFRIVGEAANGREALSLCHLVRPEVALLDVRMPEMDGLAATRAIKQQFPYIIVLILTAHEDRGYLLKALRAGAAGYVLKGASPDELVAAIWQTLDGETILDRKLSAQLLRQLANELWEPTEEEALPEPEHPEPKRALTPRELEVLELLALGQTNREIALGLSISANTVKRHVENLATKLEASDRTQAVVRALEQGVICFPE